MSNRLARPVHWTDNPAMKVYRDYDQAELDRQYDQTTLVADPSVYHARKRRESERVRAAFDCRLGVPYGPSPDEWLDIFPAAEPGAPVLVLVHGGAWKGGSARDNQFPAEALVPRGAAFVAVNFSLVPAATLAEQVRQNRAAVAWVHQHAREFGADPERIHLAGVSSGGHVGGMLAVTDWQRDWGLPADTLKGAVLVSGMYDLEPVRLTWRNRYLDLTPETAAALSPINAIRPGGIPLVLAYGEDELDEFKRQTGEMADAWRAAGNPCELLVLAGTDHYAGNFALSDPDGPLLAAVFRQMELQAG
jgi:arylformamidase